MEKIEKDLFLLNKENYEKAYKPYYKHDVKKIIQFSVVLPFYFPIDDYRAITISYNECYKTYCFKKEYKDISYLCSYDIGEMKMFDVPISKVEMTFVICGSYIDDSELSYYFDELINSLNEIIIAYKIKRKVEKVYVIRKEMIAPIIMYRIIKVEKWDENMGIFLVNNNIPYEEKILSNDEMHDLVRHCNIIMNDLNPFINSMDYLINSKRLLKQGFYEDSVINANIAVEGFIRNVYKDILIIENENTENFDVDEILKDKPFSTIIKKELSYRLGGNWNMDDNKHEVGKWNENTYKLRNRIIHGARNINYEQAVQSIESAEKCILYIKKLINSKKNKYKELNNYFN